MRVLVTLILVLVAFRLSAQQDPIYAQYLTNPMLINPAYAGLNNNLQVNASYRMQWTTLAEAPRTMNLNGNMSILDNKAGIGLSINRDKIGNQTVTEFNGAFAYKLKLKDDLTFSFGMQGGVLGFQTDNSVLNIRDDNDDAFPDGTTRTSTINLGTGVMLMSDRFIVGLSVPRLLPSKINTGSQQFELYNQHFYLFGSYVHILNERIRLKPSLLLRGVKGAPLSADVAFNLNIDMKHTVGVFVRNLNAYGVLLQTMIGDKLRLGYVFEMPSSKSVGSSFLTHELQLGLRMGVLNFHERSLSNF